jgi:cytochrome c-type biogenesis protein CcmH/NrfF
LLLAGMGALVAFYRGRRNTVAAPPPLSEEERRRLDALLKTGEQTAAGTGRSRR